MSLLPEAWVPDMQLEADIMYFRTSCGNLDDEATVVAKENLGTLLNHTGACFNGVFYERLIRNALFFHNYLVSTMLLSPWSQQLMWSTWSKYNNENPGAYKSNNLHEDILRRVYSGPMYRYLCALHIRKRGRSGFDFVIQIRFSLMSMYSCWKS